MVLWVLAVPRRACQVCVYHSRLVHGPVVQSRIAVQAMYVPPQAETTNSNEAYVKSSSIRGCSLHLLLCCRTSHNITQLITDRFQWSVSRRMRDLGNDGTVPTLSPSLTRKRLSTQVCVVQVLMRMLFECSPPLCLHHSHSRGY